MMISRRQKRVDTFSTTQQCFAVFADGAAEDDTTG